MSAGSLFYRQNTELDQEESGLELTSQMRIIHIYHTRWTSSQQAKLSTVTRRALTLSTQDNKDRKLAKPLEPITAFSRKPTPNQIGKHILDSLRDS